MPCTNFSQKFQTAIVRLRKAFTFKNQINNLKDAINNSTSVFTFKNQINNLTPAINNSTFTLENQIK